MSCDAQDRIGLFEKTATGHEDDAVEIAVTAARTHDLTGFIGLECGKFESTLVITVNHKIHPAVAKIAYSVKQDDIVFSLIHRLVLQEVGRKVALEQSGTQPAEFVYFRLHAVGGVRSIGSAFPLD
jgi:hypothetical protein